VLGLQPLAEYKQTVILSDWLRFASVGNYQFVLRYSNGAPQNNQALVTVDGSPRRVSVRARDERYLQMRCESMLQNLMSLGGRRDEQFEGAVAELAAFRDPVAVPYLERAISAETSALFFDTLVAIGTPQARDALIRLSGHPRQWVAMDAKAALTRIKAPKSV
jgi:hypothetical protein